MRAYRLSVNTFLLQMRSVLIHSLSSVNKSHQQTKDVCFLYECVSRPETRSIKTDLNCNNKVQVGDVILSQFIENIPCF